MRLALKAALVATAATTAIGVTAVPAQADAHRTIWAHAGTGTISAAVAKAHPGDTIRLDKGTFYDSVFIPITLTIKGSGWDRTVVKPPATTDNPCDSPGDMMGFCLLGVVDDQFNPDTSKPVKNVTIEDLRVTGFSDSGVFGFNTRGMHVREVRADHNGGYGVARFVSTRSVFERNWTSYNDEAGLYNGDSPDAKSIVSNNWADHNGFGVFLRDSTDITARGNKVWANCVGIMALNTGGGVPAGDYRILDNKASANDRACPAEDGPPLSGIGIALAGVQHTLVRGNDVRDNQPSGPSFASGGIVLVSTAPFGGADPNNNTIRNNHLRRNQPADIVWDGTGTGNTVKHNSCHTAIPGNLGWCHS